MPSGWRITPRICSRSTPASALHMRMMAHTLEGTMRPLSPSTT